MPQVDIDGANSKVSADTIRGQSGTTVTVQSGHNLVGSGSGLTALPAANLTGTLPAISGASLTNLFTLGTPQATTSGTSFTFGSIPSGTAVIVINFAGGVSLSGTDAILVQIGPAGGIETSGYVSSSSDFASGVATTSATAGFMIDSNYASNILAGNMTLTLQNASTFTWCETHLVKAGSARQITGAGSKALAAELTQLKILTDGSDTFDAGAINIAYI
jgi:hypothetical protein